VRVRALLLPILSAVVVIVLGWAASTESIAPPLAPTHGYDVAANSASAHSLDTSADVVGEGAQAVLGHEAVDDAVENPEFVVVELGDGGEAIAEDVFGGVFARWYETGHDRH
jgi:hypothetical protein